MNYKLTVAYDGARYRGWQRQGEGTQSIQGKLEAVLSRMEGAPVEIHGAGRTDAGVHAMGQVASVRLSGQRTPSESFVAYSLITSNNSGRFGTSDNLLSSMRKGSTL